MRFAVQDSLVPGADAVERMRSAARLGFDAIELRASTLLSLPAAQRREASMLPLPVSSIVSSEQYDPVIVDRQARDARLEAWGELIRAAGDVGARGIVMVPIRNPHHLPDLSPLYSSSELELALFYRILDRLLPQAEAAGVALWIEALNLCEATLVTTLEQAAEICRHVASPSLRLMADTFHMNISEADPLRSLERAAPYLGHVHLSDSNRQLPGRGHIEFSRILDVLDEIGYTGYGALEALVPADLERAVSESLAYLRQVARNT